MDSERARQLQELYLQMCRIRRTEQALAGLWERGLVSGELHLGLGEEAVAAGVVSVLQEGDALALDYRSTPPLVARGVDLQGILLELLGADDGLCGGRGGHMHLMSREHLAAASGIVGAPAPLACGFGLAAKHARRGRVAVGFFGDGAVNQGMVMESLNLAAVWRLPVLFVCKDNRWAATTRSGRLTGGGLPRRLRAYGIPVARVDGADVEKVRRTAARAVARARAGGGPSVLLARCERSEGHFTSDTLVRLTRAIGELAAEIRRLLRSLQDRPGAPLPQRLGALLSLSARLATVAVEVRRSGHDPLRRAARRLPAHVAGRVERQAATEVDEAVSAALRRHEAVPDA